MKSIKNGTFQKDATKTRRTFPYGRDKSDCINFLQGPGETFDGNFSVIQRKAARTDRLSTCRGASGHFGKPSRRFRKLSLPSRREDRPDGRIRAGVCTRAEVIFCALDPLSFFFFVDRPSSHAASQQPFRLLPLYPSPKPSQSTFFPPRPCLRLFLFRSPSLSIFPRRFVSTHGRYGTRHETHYQLNNSGGPFLIPPPLEEKLPPRKTLIKK